VCLNGDEQVDDLQSWCDGGRSKVGGRWVKRRRPAVGCLVVGRTRTLVE